MYPRTPMYPEYPLYPENQRYNEYAMYPSYYLSRAYATPVNVLNNLKGRHIQFYGDVTGITYIGRLNYVYDSGDPTKDYIEVEVYLPPNNQIQYMTFYTREISEVIPYTGPIPPYS